MTYIFSFPGYESLAHQIGQRISAIPGELTVRSFPDGESYVRIKTSVEGHDVLIVCGLEYPDNKAMALMFFAATAKKQGARSVGLMAPYLGYMRQDKAFHPGEAITSEIFARFLSGYVDWLITIDPHLHRHHSLDEIYTLKGIVVHATDLIADWIRTEIPNPLCIGPDEESRQWVEAISRKAEAPCIVLQKIRRGDTDVEVSIPDAERYMDATPVLIDDIISTAHTMRETILHLHHLGMKPPVCIGIHAIFSGDAYQQLLKAGIERVVTCNTIVHPSNALDVSGIMADAYSNISGAHK